MRPARVHGDVARNGAGQLAGRVRRVKPPVGFDSPCHRQIGAARLHPNEAIVVIRLDHAVHPRHTQHHAIGGGKTAPRQRGARAARHDLDTHLAAQAQNGGNLGRRARQNHRQRRAAIGGKRITFIGARLGGVGDHGIGRQHAAQARDQPIAAGDNPLIGQWHIHSAPHFWRP